MTNVYSTRTQLLQVNPQRPQAPIIRRAARILLEKGLVAFPTETVYGLGANALDDRAVSRIFEVKRRPFFDPLIVHIAEKSMIEFVAVDIPEIAYRLADEFWPGPLTFVLKRHKRVAERVSAGMETVAVRMPNHRVPLALIRAAEVPVAAPSANLFSRPSPTNAQHVMDDLAGHVDLILDGGPCPIGLESTVLDLTVSTPAILRPGGTPAETLSKFIPDLAWPVQASVTEDEKAISSPGMLLKHYSPKAKFLLLAGGGPDASSKTLAMISALVSQGFKVGVMTTDEDSGQYSDVAVHLERLGPQNDCAEIGRNLFDRMRSLDKQGVDFIVMRSVTDQGLGAAISDRLFKAAEQQIINLDQPADIQAIINRHQKH